MGYIVIDSLEMYAAPEGDDSYPVTVQKILNAMNQRGFELAAIEQAGPLIDRALYIFKHRPDMYEFSTVRR
jgi:hypothetical protein